MQGRLVLFVCTVFFVAAGARKCTIKDLNEAPGGFVPCRKQPLNRRQCERTTIPRVPGTKETCCYVETGDSSAGNCFAIYTDKNQPKPSRQSQQRALGGGSADGDLEDFAKKQGIPVKPPKEEAQKIIARMQSQTNFDAKELGGENEVKKLKENVNTQSRSLNFLTSPFGLGALTGQSIFPECPVHVKLCHRVQCGGPFANNNPTRCLSDPRCCYDYKLAFMRSVFGPRYMAHAPSCYYGATSRQWVYITSFFQPWNAWYTSFILDAFEGLFNTNAFNIGGKFVCDLTFGRKAYPVGSKSELQCNLVSGCWDASLPTGSQCFMASDQIQQLFGQNNVYPSLFTNDPSETQCSANWFEFGPKAYRRLPCGIGPAPPRLFDMIYQWCPITDCCLNYAAISAEQRRDLQLLSFATGGGLNLGGGTLGFGQTNLFGLPNTGFGNQNPLGGFGLNGLSGLVPGQTAVNPALFQYLLSGSIGDDLSDLFCPYRALSLSSLFPDLSDVTEGCCDIPTCYHKKKLVGGPPPSIAQPPPAPYEWGPWNRCSVSCGSGVQSRACYFRGQPQQTSNCAGQASRPCQLAPCPVRYNFGPFGRCSVSCGRGIQRRACYSGNTLIQQSNLCQGPVTQVCQQPPCPIIATWGQWEQVSSCSVTCGNGMIRYSRKCFAGSQETNIANCPGQATRTGPCNQGPCRPVYQWGNDMVLKRGCSVTCGQGFEMHGYPCQDANGRYVQDNLCQGNPRNQNRRCAREPCPQPITWGDWRKVTECGATCGPYGLLREERACYFQTGGEAPRQLCPSGVRDRLVRCASPECPPDQYYYALDANPPPCSRGPNGLCQRVVRRICFSKSGPNSYARVQDQSSCPGPLQSVERCGPC